MKKTITLMAFVLSLSQLSAQITVADFESFVLPANSAYSSTASVPFQTTNGIFPYGNGTPGNYWASGFSYTNKYDSATAGFGNMYGVKPLKGYNSSNVYVVGQDKGIIKLKAPFNSLDGFYVTNTTYAYKSMKLGDQFAKKFGGNTGNDPDWFKLVVRGYLNGALKTDSVAFYLADFRFSNNTQDYIVNTWQYVSTTNLGQVDSVKFYLSSSDVGQFGMNTPAYFGMDNFSTTTVVGVNENSLTSKLSVYPNPVLLGINIDIAGSENQALTVRVLDTTGKVVINTTTTDSKSYINLQDLEKGVYFAEISNGEQKTVKKLIKE